MTSKTGIVAVQLETCHANTDGTAWYAYSTEPLPTGPLSADLRKEIVRLAKKDGAPLSPAFEDDPEEVPSALSKAAGLRRYYVACAE